MRFGVAGDGDEVAEVEVELEHARELRAQLGSHRRAADHQRVVLVGDLEVDRLPAQDLGAAQDALVAGPAEGSEQIPAVRDDGGGEVEGGGDGRNRTGG